MNIHLGHNQKRVPPYGASAVLVSLFVAAAALTGCGGGSTVPAGGKVEASATTGAERSRIGRVPFVDLALRLDEIHLSAEQRASIEAIEMNFPSNVS